jgi:hypothetical protein
MDNNLRWKFIRGITLISLANRWQTDTLDLNPDLLSILIGTLCHFTFKPTAANSGKAWQYLKVMPHCKGTATTPAMLIKNLWTTSDQKKIFPIFGHKLTKWQS